MVQPENPSLRPIWRQLRDVEAALGTNIDGAEAAQETLDLLALQARLKPVCLLGRGLDDPQWIAGALAIARTTGLNAVEGPYWDATPFDDHWPGWYVDRTVAALAPFRAWYLCRQETVARSVAAVCAAGGRLAVAEEARLLGYPECCVAAHYDRALAYHRAILSVLDRLAGGDARRMADLLAGDTPLEPKTAAERAGFEAAVAIIPAPFGSWNLCDDCARDSDGPSARLSRRYAALARAVDAGWAETLASSGVPRPRWTP